MLRDRAFASSSHFLEHQIQDLEVLEDSCIYMALVLFIFYS